MRYVGGKSKLARRISDLVVTHAGDRDIYIEPFVGGGAVLAATAPMFARVVAADVVPDLILLWEAVAGGWLPPEVITRDQYAALRHADPSALRGFVGFGGSFGGKWFGGYAAGGTNADGSPRNHQAESRRRIASMAPAIRNAEFRLCDYRDLGGEMGPRVVVYADPPYAGTMAYGAADPFDSAEFWATMDQWRTAGAVVLVSEYEAPRGWRPVAEIPHRQTVQRGDRERFTTTERVWV